MSARAGALRGTPGAGAREVAGAVAGPPAGVMLAGGTEVSGAVGGLRVVALPPGVPALDGAVAEHAEVTPAPPTAIAAARRERVCRRVIVTSRASLTTAAG